MQGCMLYMSGCRTSVLSRDQVTHERCSCRLRINAVITPAEFRKRRGQRLEPQDPPDELPGLPLAIEVGELPAASHFEAAVAEASSARCCCCLSTSSCVASICMCTGIRHMRHSAWIIAYTQLAAACRRSTVFVDQHMGVLDSLELWRSDIAKQLLGGEPVVWQALSAYLRCGTPYSLSCPGQTWRVDCA